MDKAKDFADEHDEQVDQGLDRAGDEVNKRTGDKYEQKVDKAVDTAQQRTGGGEQAS
jgi:hypothetical protein